LVVKKVVLSKKKMVLKQENRIELNDFIQVLEGLGVKEAIADNAQYLMDSESFIKTE
jgi:Cu(I)/Ag(I) efflux system membrane fusion protein